MRKIFIIIAVAWAVIVVISAGPGAAESAGTKTLVLGTTPPGNEPEQFLPDVITESIHSAPSFSPDGTEMYWSRYYTPDGERSRTQHIFVCRFDNGKWSAPELAPFSGNYSDGGPFVTSDGSKLFFYSNRPAEPGGTPADEYISDVWHVERSGDGWGEPQRLSFNTDKHEGMASVAENGNIYFQANRPGTRGIFDAWVSELIDGEYTTPKNLGPAVNCPQINFSPLVAPDESYVILAYNNNSPDNGLHVSFRKPGGGWAKAVSMGPKINSGSTQRFPGLTPDGEYLFFVRAVARKGVTYWVDAGIIEELRKQVLGE